jgi:phosphoglucosamine mutase
MNVRVKKKEDFSDHPEIASAMEDVTGELGEAGRLNVRYSGTEPVARVMVEGPDQGRIEKQARFIADAIVRHLGE